MGSVEVFPRRPGTPAAVEGVRGCLAGSGVVRVREARLEDYAALRALHREAAPHLPAWTLRQLEGLRHAFTAGQLVAACDGRIVGAAASVVVAWDDHGPEPTQRALTADGHFTTHDPGGDTLYGFALLSDGSRHGFAAARALFQARRRLCRRMNLRRIFVPLRLSGYARAAPALTPERFAMRVVCGDIPDAAMRFHMAQGFQFAGVLHGHVPEDLDSGGHAALLAWLNPLHSPPGQAATAQAATAQRARCA